MSELQSVPSGRLATDGYELHPYVHYLHNDLLHAEQHQQEEANLRDLCEFQGSHVLWWGENKPGSNATTEKKNKLKCGYLLIQMKDMERIC